MKNLFKYSTFHDSQLNNSKLGLFFIFKSRKIFKASHFFKKFKNISVANSNLSYLLFQFLYNILSVYAEKKEEENGFLNSEIRFDFLFLEENMDDIVSLQVLLS